MEEFVEKTRICDILLTGANRRYPEITEVIRERLDFELLTISNSGYPLLLDCTGSYCRSPSMGVSVGPGRGSAAGSVVLLFENYKY
jgi:DNA polymerase-3 subunit alpha